MSIDTSKTVPFTDVASDFMKLVTVSDNTKSSTIDFAATDFASLREALIKYIRAVYPLDYNNFVESDLGLMLIELVSYMGAVLSMKADMLAHENFIQTAKDRDSVRKLFELVGISLKGPTSAQAAASLSLDGETGDFEDDIVLLPGERVISTTSPADTEALSFTLYKSTNGVVDPLDSTNSNLILTSANRPSGSTDTWDVVLLEGAFAAESGTFATLDSFKSIQLQESPVVQNSVQMFVDSGEVATSGSYRQVENLYQASSVSDKLFQVVYGDDFSAKILFGNGVNGISPADGADYFVTYRVGGGDRGNVPNNYINALTTGTYDGNPKSIRITQSQIATGGSDPETVDHAKKYGPLSFRQQDRIVSLEDYTSFASRFISPAGTTGKAVAVARKAYSSSNIIDLYILEKATTSQLQKASISFKDALLTAIADKKLITDDVVIADGLIRTLDLVITINIDRRFQGIESTIVTKVSQAINNFFLSDNMDFGDTVVFANLTRQIFSIPEVRYSTIDNFDQESINVDFNEVIQLNNLVINVSYV